MTKGKYPEGLTPQEKLQYRSTSVIDTAIANESGLVAVIEQNQFTKKLEVSFEDENRFDTEALPGSNQHVVRIEHPDTGELLKLKRNKEEGSISKEL